METLTKEELKKALRKLEQDRSSTIDKLYANKRERKELEEDFDHFYETIQDLKERLKDLTKKDKS